ncbi:MULTISPECIES: hypothetical protein [Methylobacterium]|uniref:hypothetical protein n=1 Tax=Methylobacterium TaxID=407 RepID=UPI0013EB2660|nr:hypothetical protein [Methylobacterium sp. DB0501]NGM34503.1 hypothetical protein [Methylobacterium sp. DB0501]
MKLTKEGFERIATAGLETAQRYALPILVFDSAKQKVNTATGTIIRTAKGALMATAGHVIEEFVGLGDTGRMQIGGMGYVLKNISADRIKIARNVDFGVIHLTDDDALGAKWSIFPDSNLHFDGVQQMDLVAYVGFPGCWKKIESAKTMVMGRLFCVGAIETIEQDQFSIRIDERRYDSEQGVAGPLDDLGGISGAPVFSLLDFRKSRMRAPLLVGWIHEGMAWEELNQKHYVVQASFVKSLFL